MFHRSIGFSNVFFAFPKKILLFNSVTGFLQGGSGFIESGCPYIQAPLFGILLTRVFSTEITSRAGRYKEVMAWIG